MRLTTSKFVLASLVGGALALSTPAFAAAPSACGDTTQAPNKTAPADAAKVQIPITGMSCDGCATAIHNALLKVDGVYVADVTFASGTAVIAYDNKKVQVDALVKVIEEAGYKTGKPSGS